MRRVQSIQARLLLALGLLSGMSVAFYVVSAISGRGPDYRYMVWNLCLAWLPLLFTWLLVQVLYHRSWFAWQALALTLVWLIFLPNSFYMVSDFIHLNEISSADILYDVVMFLLFALSGLALGFISLYIVHRRLLERLRRRSSHSFVGLILLLCSFAIYLGRDLRWNSWDAVFHPAGLLFDISDPLVNPTTHVDAFTTTFMFFVLLGTLYVAVWQLIGALRSQD